MTTLHGFAGQDFAREWLVRSMGWTLLHFCWQGTLIAIVLWCVLRLLGGGSAQARYLAACCALGLMAVLPVATLVHVGLAEYRLAAALRRPIEVGPALIAQAGLGDVRTPWLARTAAALDPALPWVLMAWLAGAALFLLRLSVGFGVTRRMRSVAVHAASAELQVVFEGLRRRLGVSRPVMLINSALVQVPTVIGWLRPVVLIPLSCFTGLSETQIEAVLCHELAHVRRHDYLVSVLQSVMEALLFYHPGVWWVSRQLRRERECCCDDVAVSVGADALAYARALSALEVRRSAYPPGDAWGGWRSVDHAYQTFIARQRECGGIAGCGGDGADDAGCFDGMDRRSGQGRDQRGASGFSSGHSNSTFSRADQGKSDFSEMGERHRGHAGGLQESCSECHPSSEHCTYQRQGKDDSERDRIQRPRCCSDASSYQPTSSQGPVRISGGVMAGQAISKVQPVYPPEAKAAHVQGAVVLHAVISKTGEVASLEVVSGPQELVDSALTAVRQWSYKAVSAEWQSHRG